MEITIVLHVTARNNEGKDDNVLKNDKRLLTCCVSAIADNLQFLYDTFFYTFDFGNSDLNWGYQVSVNSFKDVYLSKQLLYYPPSSSWNYDGEKKGNC
jgi:hypothetical protein